MAKKTTCDRCGGVGVTTLVAATGNTTKIEMDLCEECLAEYKWLMREFAKKHEPVTN